VFLEVSVADAIMGRHKCNDSNNALHPETAALFAKEPHGILTSLNPTIRLLGRYHPSHPQSSPHTHLIDKKTKAQRDTQLS
jgi:hypothetical protein